MRVSLMVPCFVDQFFPEAALAAVEVLERLGHSVEVPASFVCCGQPPFNSGYFGEARAIAGTVLKSFANADAVVVCSGSCATMVKKFYGDLFTGTAREAEAAALGEKIWEFAQFLVNRLGVEDVGASFAHRVTYHDGCHGLRELGILSEPRRLLANVRGLELVEMDTTVGLACCGFGGTFAVKFPMISTAMGEGKCAGIARTGADYVVSGDPSCLMQVGGILTRARSNVRPMYLAEVLNQR